MLGFYKYNSECVNFLPCKTYFSINYGNKGVWMKSRQRIKKEKSQERVEIYLVQNNKNFLTNHGT